MKFSLYVTALLLGATCTFASKDLDFTLHGVPHHETVDTVGGLVILEDVDDNFIVILDYNRDLVTVKITKQPEACYIGQRSDTLFSRDNNEAVFVAGNGQATYEEGTVLSFDKGDPIIPEELTNEAEVLRQCSGVDSYELIKTGDTHTRSARGARGDTVIIIIIRE